MKKGFGLVGILITIGAIIILCGGGYYYSKEKNNNPDTDNILEVAKDTENIEKNSQPDQENFQQYTSKTLGLSFYYPKEFKIREMSQQIPSELGTVIVYLTKYDDKRGKPMDCSGYPLQADEVSINVSLFTEELPYFSKYEQYPEITLGDKTVNVNRGIGGMCGKADGYLLRLDNGNTVEIYVRPSETQYMKEAEAIISSLEFN
jgi:hypothetical protein